jgi:hypothetical protein
VRSRMMLVAVLGITTQALSAQELPAKLMTLTLGFSCQERPITATDTIYRSEDLPLSHPPGKPKPDKVTTFEWPSSPPAGYVPGVPQAPVTTTLRFVLDTTGEIDVCSIEVLDETSREWTRSLLAVMKSWRFRPGDVDGHPVRISYTVRLVSHYYGN